MVFASLLARATRVGSVGCLARVFTLVFVSILARVGGLVSASILARDIALDVAVFVARAFVLGFVSMMARSGTLVFADVVARVAPLVVAKEVARVIRLGAALVMARTPRVVSLFFSWLAFVLWASRLRWLFSLLFYLGIRRTSQRPNSPLGARRQRIRMQRQSHSRSELAACCLGPLAPTPLSMPSRVHRLPLRRVTRTHSPRGFVGPTMPCSACTRE